MFTLHYRADTPLGVKFPLWFFGRFSNAVTGEAVRRQCANADQIEVVEVDE